MLFAQQLACLLSPDGAQCAELSWNGAGGKGFFLLSDCFFSVLFPSRTLCNPFSQFPARFLSKCSIQVASQILVFAHGFDFPAPTQ